MSEPCSYPWEFIDNKVRNCTNADYGYGTKCDDFTNCDCTPSLANLNCPTNWQCATTTDLGKVCESPSGNDFCIPMPHCPNS